MQLLKLSAWQHTLLPSLHTWLWLWRAVFRSQDILWCLHPSQASLLSFLPLSDDLILGSLFALLAHSQMKYISEHYVRTSSDLILLCLNSLVLAMP